jgi:hypothetical protein
MQLAKFVLFLFTSNDPVCAIPIHICCSHNTDLQRASILQLHIHSEFAPQRKLIKREYDEVVE